MSRLKDRPVLLITGAALIGVLVVVLLLTVLDNGSGTTTTTGTEAAAVGSTPTASDPAVAELQRTMTRLGYYHGPIDGIYGSATTDAVKQMQSALGVTADGVYGPATATALKNKAVEITKKIQTELTAYGYYSGPIDGDYGPATTDAVKKLQTDLGVTADGQVGPATVAAFQQAVADGTLTSTTTTTTTAATTT